LEFLLILQKAFLPVRLGLDIDLNHNLGLFIAFGALNQDKLQENHLYAKIKCSLNNLGLLATHELAPNINREFPNGAFGRRHLS